MKNIKCLLSYSGTHYFGFQKTNQGPSIEEALENALEKILQHPVKIQAASRTDRGVHAEGQVINFFIQKEIDLETLHRSLQGLLPKDITPLKLEKRDEQFHPTLDTIGKEYHYLICNSPIQLPFHRKFSWHSPLPLNLEEMEKGAKLFEGQKDFSAFTSLSYQNPIRTLKKIKLTPLEHNRLRIEMIGDNFLYRMARNVVGTLIYIGQGKISLNSLPEIFEKRKRALAGVCAPAHGLFLKRVFY